MIRIVIILLFISGSFAMAKNPIIPNKGANDPHIRIIDGKAYLSASHDKSADNSQFIMEDWWLWSSDDLVNWELEYVLNPEETYIGQPFTGCWATDFVKRNGKYYWYFSERNRQAGVVVAESPSGPWKDPLEKPLLHKDLTPTHEYDMGIFQDTDGEYYIIFGVWDFYIARLNDDMISLAEKPRKITIFNPRGPYNPDGHNKEKPTDDKPFLHFYNGKYYLSWGCFYAMSDNVYGPYDYKGSIIEKESFAPGYASPTWPNGFKQGRHGSFFEWHNQWYFAYCDISQTGNRYFRDTFISYVHYKENGEMALIRIDGTGVGEYVANQCIEAEDYFKAEGLSKKQDNRAGIVLGRLENENYLFYPNIRKTGNRSTIGFNIKVEKEVEVEIRENSQRGKLLNKCTIPQTGTNHFEKVWCNIGNQADKLDLCLVFKGEGGEKIQFDSFEFK